MEFESPFEARWEREMFVRRVSVMVGLVVASMWVLVGPAAAQDDQRSGKNGKLDAAWSASYGAGLRALHAKRFEEAEAQLVKAFEAADRMESTDPRHKKTLETLVKLRMVQRQWAAAEPWLEKIVALDEQNHGPRHLEVSFSVARLAANQLMMRKFDQAEANFRRALAVVLEHGGENDPGVAKLRHNLAEVFRRSKRLDKAEALYKEVLAHKEEIHGKDDPALASSLNDLALIYVQQRKHSQAVPLLQRAARLAAKLGKQHATLGSVQHNLADALAGTGKVAEAEKLYRSSIAIKGALKPPDRPGLGNSWNNLGTLLQRNRQHDQALAAYQKAIEIRIAEFGKTHRSVQRARLNMASCLDQLGKAGEAAAIRAEYGP